MLRNTLFSIWIVVSLFASTIGLGVFAFSQALRVASLTTELASSATELAAAKAAHKTELAKQKGKLQAKARLRRSLIAVPVLGASLLVYFEEQDFREWLENNPNGSRSDYACEVASYSAEILNEMVISVVDAGQSLPELVRPKPDQIKQLLALPNCSN